MFSECEDDLCIFVCGTCKRYFTQLSAFSQHKKEKLCKKKSPGSVLLKDSIVGPGASHDIIEDNENDESVADTSAGLNDTFTDAEDNSQRKYPRKQDKKLIKRTIRDLENENLLSAEGKLDVTAPHDPFSQTDGRNLALTSPDAQRSCKHPMYVCKTCHAEFPNTNGRVFKCVDCRRGFYTEADLNQHMVRAKHNNLCAVCGKIFPDKYKLRKHELSHVTEKNFRCEEPGCTKSFKSAEDVRTHVRYVHAVEKRFHCTHCPRAFTRLDKYKSHMNTHGITLKPGPVSPSQMGTKAVEGTNSLALETSPAEETPGNLSLFHPTPVTEVVHTVEVSASVANSHPSPAPEESADATDLDVVGKTDLSEGGAAVVPFPSSSEFSTSNYNSPMVSTEGQSEPDQPMNSSQSSGQSQSEEGQKCQRCQTRYQTSLEFVAHEERRADHVLRCAHCSVKYLSVCELRYHIRAQHGVEFLPHVEQKPTPAKKKERKHFCQECGKGFTRPDKLKRHTIIHSPNRPCIPCSCKESHGCDRTFYRNDSMKRHALTHSLDKPYVCEECGKSFSRPDYLTKHVGHVHKRAFKHLCTLCDYGTREAKRLKIHIRSKHELDPELFLATDGSESALGPSMANPGESARTVESPLDSPREMNLSGREVTTPDEEINLVNTGEVDPTGETDHTGETSLGEINLRELNPKQMNTGESDASLSEMDPIQHTGRMNPSIGDSNLGGMNLRELEDPSRELAQNTRVHSNLGEAHTGVIEPLTPSQIHQRPMDIERHSLDVSSPAEHQVAGELSPVERYRSIETPGSINSPRDSESSPGNSSPVTRQSVISQDLGVPELRLMPDFQDINRHAFNEPNRRPPEFLSDQSMRSRYPFGYPPQDIRPQYTMSAEFTSLSHQSGLTQFAPHQPMFTNVHMQFPGGSGHLPNYERKTPLNSRPVSSQAQFWRS